MQFRNKFTSLIWTYRKGLVVQIVFLNKCFDVEVYDELDKGHFYERRGTMSSVFSLQVF